MTPPAYTRHPEYRSFLRAIRKAPDDDLPRLILADWLEERAGSCESCGGKATWSKWTDVLPAHNTARRNDGRFACSTCHGTGTNGAGERGGFIRVQIEAARTENEADAFALDKRAEEILTKMPPFAGELGRSISDWDWHRGFIATVRCTLAQFEQHAGAIAREHPVTRWELTDCEPCQQENRSESAVYIGRWRWFWTLERYVPRLEWGLPYELYKRASDFYPTRKAALDTLNAACVIVANERAEVLENQPTYREVVDDLFDTIAASLGVPERILADAANTLTTRG